MVAYTFVKIGAHASGDVLAAIREVPGVKQAHVLLGPIDCIVFTEFEDLAGLANVVQEIRAVDGVANTDTRLAFPV